VPWPKGASTSRGNALTHESVQALREGIDEVRRRVQATLK